jgi:hypothetical protein
MSDVASAVPNSGYLEAVRRQAAALGIRSALAAGGCRQPLAAIPMEHARGSVEFERWQQSQPR